MRASIVPSWLRGGLGVLQSVSPDTAGRAAAALFFRTRRAPIRSGAETLLRGARFSVAFEGERLAAWSWGRGPTVALVHGWNGRAAQLADLVEPLTSSGLRVVAFDHVGHGESTGDETTLPQMARALRAVVEASGGARALVAHSLGAGAAVLALHDGLDVDRAVLIAPPTSPEPWVDRMGRLLGLDERTLGATRRHIEARAGRSIDELHVPTLAKSLRTRGLIVHDRDDREVDIAAGEALSYAWPRSRLLVTAGLGHYRILRSPGVIESARRFVLADE
jgi:pimeloyl-ACP methyl ester carboxylesterase